MRIKKLTLLFFLMIISNLVWANSKVLNLYVWDGEIPTAVINKFEKKTGIHVNYTTYNSNEVLYAKLKARKNPEYDIVEPSSYYIKRMRDSGMLHPINKAKLPNYKYIMKKFRDPGYDPHNNYSIPYMWGVTGIFVNKKYYNPKNIMSWSDFWEKKYFNKIMLLNDPREVFSIGLMTLGFSPNSNNPGQVKKAYKNLLKLLPNVKVFNSDAIPSIFIDADVTIGMAWNGDVYKGMQENPNLTFIYPKDGFVIWADCLTILKNAPHLINAYKFLNFLMKPENSALVTSTYGYPTANAEAKKYLSPNLRDNKVIFPSEKTLERGHFQKSIGSKGLKLYAKYWEQLKLNA